MKIETAKIATAALNTYTTGFAGMDAETPVTGITGGKSNPYVGNTTKRQRLLVLVSASPATYENSVNNGLDREGSETEFVAGSLPKNREWVEGYEGLLLEGTPASGEFTQYLRCYIRKVLDTTYYYNGEEIAKEDIVGFPKPRKASGQGGLVKQIYPRDYKLQNIEALRYDSNEWK